MTGFVNKLLFIKEFIKPFNP